MYWILREGYTYWEKAILVSTSCECSVRVFNSYNILVMNMTDISDISRYQYLQVGLSIPIFTILEGFRPSGNLYIRIIDYGTLQCNVAFSALSDYSSYLFYNIFGVAVAMAICIMKVIMWKMKNGCVQWAGI